MSSWTVAEEEETISANCVATRFDIVRNDVLESHVGFVHDVPLAAYWSDVAFFGKGDLQVVAWKDVGKIMREYLLIGDRELLKDRLAEAVRHWRSRDGWYLPQQQDNQQCKYVQLELHKYLITIINNLSTWES